MALAFGLDDATLAVQRMAIADLASTPWLQGLKTRTLLVGHWLIIGEKQEANRHSGISCRIVLNGEPMLMLITSLRLLADQDQGRNSVLAVIGIPAVPIATIDCRSTSRLFRFAFTSTLAPGIPAIDHVRKSQYDF